MKRKEVILHRDLQTIKNNAYSNLLLSFVVGLVTYWVRLFSYTEAGPLYGASIVISLTSFLIFTVYFPQVGRGNRSMNFKRSYQGLLSIAPKMATINGVSLGIFGGNVFYYASRARIWSDPAQWIFMFKHAVHVPGVIFGTVISFIFLLSLFTGEKYIESKDYRKRMRYKTEIRGLTPVEAFNEIISEQDKYHEFGIAYEQMNTKEGNNDQTESGVNKKTTEKTDPFAGVRVNRGGKQ